MSDRPLRIVIGGMLAGDPHQGGATWAVLQYALGLQRLGHDVTVVEPVTEPTDDVRAYFAAVTGDVDARLGGPVPDADVLLNIAGMLREGIERIPIRVYLDLDPVFNQLWHLQGVDAGMDGHTHYASVGLRLPETGHDWIHTLPPVCLERWPVAHAVELDAFTTVGNWRAYGPIEHEGVRYGQRVHSVRRFLDLPRRTDERFAIALDIHPDETSDLAALREHGWSLLDPRAVAGTPETYGDFVRGSKGEIGIAKEGYVVSHSGWFSDRSACYLASGRPVIAQDTGFGEALPTGAGLFPVSTIEDALEAIDALRADYGRHARAARAIAEEYLDSDVVLARLLRAVEALPPARRSVHETTEHELADLVGARTVKRRPFAYRSSAPIVELEADGRKLLLKDLSRSALIRPALAAKPAFLHDPLREIVVYRDLLSGHDLGTPELVAADTDRQWLVIEEVAGAELYQVGELETWARVLRWLAGFHETFRDVDHREPLIRYDEAFFRQWAAPADVSSSSYDAACERLARLPTTLVHGELYASNVIVSESRICAVDWELAGIGSGLLDVASLVVGWGDAERELLADAYGSALAEAPTHDALMRDLDCAGAVVAARWLAAAGEWTPPPEHARDWGAELRDRLERARS